MEALSAVPVADGLVPARVVGVERGWCKVASPSGELLLPVPHVAVGDWVMLDGDTVAEVLPRWSSLERLDPGGGSQVLAANIDIVLIAAPGDRLSSARIERELVIVWDSGARPVVVVTKLDVAPAGAVDQLIGGARDRRRARHQCRDRRGTRCRSVRFSCIPVTAALLGPSGAGKSTLVNALLGEARLAVGEVRDDDQRGRHTTTSRQLVPLPSGGSLVDMPGLRSLGTDAQRRRDRGRVPRHRGAARARVASPTARTRSSPTAR